MSICNFRCHYCYLAQRKVHYQGIQPVMKYTPSQVARALSKKRLGGSCFFNFCAEGETLLTKNIDQYVLELVKEGHYVEIVTNLTVSNVLERILEWDKDLLSRIEFKCSFHYLELKKKGKLELFAENVHKIWSAGASANIEITPTDELIPYIDEVKEFSMNYFGALPHLSIARNDRTKNIDYLTNLSLKEYDSIWSQFGSDFWAFKKTIFGIKQKRFCYAGKWSAYIDLSTGFASACYGYRSLGNVFETPELPFPEKPICKCPIKHCYNGHALLTMGVIPHHNDIHYGDIRDRRTQDGGNWLQPNLKKFFNEKVEDSNQLLTPIQEISEYNSYLLEKAHNLIDRIIKK